VDDTPAAAASERRAGPTGPHPAPTSGAPPPVAVRGRRRTAGTRGRAGDAAAGWRWRTAGWPPPGTAAPAAASTARRRARPAPARRQTAPSGTALVRGAVRRPPPALPRPPARP